MATLISGTCAASAAPLVCTTTYNSTGGGTALETSVCKSIETQNERIGEEIYTWRPPYSSGIGVFQGIAEDLGLAFGGINGTHFVGIGYPDQTIVWDGGILQKSIEELLELQAEPLPLRTADLPNAFESSLANASFDESTPNQAPTDDSPMRAHPLW
ncbi:hypothetical protein [Synechococcus sp. MU1650]|uniref:hypothetical protein n=1 Tax=Synechococcus sp. MU1650 TaxID=2508352 RepID=UPI001CF8AB9C|nr:hypothetical protein [Synechococcus sp. MU1650]MCB4377914.1 hypothetical protein [Synechococcus sp. MU1650]